MIAQLLNTINNTQQNITKLTDCRNNQTCMENISGRPTGSYKFAKKYTHRTEILLNKNCVAIN